MSRRIAALVIVGMIVGVGSAYAQESLRGRAGRSDIHAGGCGILHLERRLAEFRQLRLRHGRRPSTSIASSASRASRIDDRHDVGSQFGDLDSNIKAPNMLSYTGNVVVSPGPATRSCRTRPAESAG